MWQIMIFFLGALVLAGLSWRFFQDTRSYRFLRFLAFEAVWAVTVINIPWWSLEFSSAMQLVSWALLLGSLGFAIGGFFLLLTAGRPMRKGSSADFAFGRPSRLVTSGPYHYVRHPLYTSLILLVWGEALKSGSFFSFVFSLLATGLVYITALLEEEENIDRFGEAYVKYMTGTRMFLPGVF